MKNCNCSDENKNIQLLSMESTIVEIKDALVGMRELIRQMQSDIKNIKESCSKCDDTAHEQDTFDNQSEDDDAYDR